MKQITKNALNSTFSSRAVVDRIRDTKASHLVEQVNINKEFKSPLTPAMLYNYYMSICLVPHYDLTDDTKVSKQLGYPAKTVGNVRRKLQKASWIFFTKFMHEGVGYGKWYIGKDVVNAYKLNEGTLTLQEQFELGVITEEEYTIIGELNG